jgi:signal peptidase I
VKRVLFVAVLTLAGVVGAMVAALILLVSTGTLKLYRIPTSAMEPTLRCAEPGVGCSAERSDRVLVFTRFVSYDRGDIVVFDAPQKAREKCGVGGTFVKRIVGLAGETLELRLTRGREYVFIDGQRFEERYVDAERRGFGPADSWTIPPDHFFVMGDNRSQSCDSRVWGTLPTESVKGQLFAHYWPPDRMGIS